MKSVASASALQADSVALRRVSGHHYSAFGGVLHSDVEFPELSVAGPCEYPDWTLRVVRAQPPEYSLIPLGERWAGQERDHLARFPGGFRLEYSHAGVFDVVNDGKSIVWYHREDALPELVRSIVLGPAIALALELAGFLCLHGSAVAFGGATLAFLGPKHFGKSTLATALTTAGGRLVGDDLLVVSPGPSATVRPGVASVRLWADVAAALPLSTVCDTLIPGVKTTATGFVSDALAATPTILKTVYVLFPVAPHADVRPVWRTRLAPMEATIALAHQTKLPDSLVGFRAAGSQLAAAAAVAATVPVWTLHVSRDIERLDETVRQIIDWSRAE